jgi:hypothetical protein
MPERRVVHAGLDAVLGLEEPVGDERLWVVEHVRVVEDAPCPTEDAEREAQRRETRCSHIFATTVLPLGMTWPQYCARVSISIADVSRRAP